jgi:hypothetical protein
MLVLRLVFLGSCIPSRIDVILVTTGSDGSSPESILQRQGNKYTQWIFNTVIFTLLTPDIRLSQGQAETLRRVQGATVDTAVLQNQFNKTIAGFSQQLDHIAGG